MPMQQWTMPPDTMPINVLALFPGLWPGNEARTSGIQTVKDFEVNEVYSYKWVGRNMPSYSP